MDFMNLNTWGEEGGGLIRSEGKYELEWLKQFNADKDERFIQIVMQMNCYVIRSS